MLAFLATVGGVFGLKGKLAAAAGIAVALVLLCGLLFGLKSCYDAQVIDTHDARQEASTAKADRKADEHAAEQRREDDARLAAERADLERVNANAPSAADRRLARHRCLRSQQDARASGRVAPACS